MSFLLLMLAASSTCLAGSGHAQSLTERQTMQHEDAVLADSVAEMNNHCGTAIKAGFDWASFLRDGEVGDLGWRFGNAPSTVCLGPIGILRSLCQDPEYRPAILTKIKSFACIYKDAPAEAHALRDDGTLELRTSYPLYHKGTISSSGLSSLHWLMHRLSSSNVCPQDCF